MYGGGAVLVRELARRYGGGWPTIALLACAYALIEEGPLDQLLWNGSYPGVDSFHTASYVPALGTSVELIQTVIALHAVWSICVPIALVETFVPERRATPWLGRTGLIVIATIYALGAAFVFWGNYSEYHFIAPATPQSPHRHRHRGVGDRRLRHRVAAAACAGFPRSGPLARRRRGSGGDQRLLDDLRVRHFGVERVGGHRDLVPRRRRWSGRDLAMVATTRLGCPASLFVGRRGDADLRLAGVPDAALGRRFCDRRSGEQRGIRSYSRDGVGSCGPGGDAVARGASSSAGLGLRIKLTARATRPMATLTHNAE